MKITSFVRTQLVAFTIVAIIAVVAVAVFYVKVPAMFGVGRYDVRLDLPNTGGLYENANVSFRGVTVGTVESVRLTPDGVQATLSVDSGAQIPADSTASVRSVSAVGEQFVEFTPPASESGSGGAGSALLHDGSVVTSTEVPVEISTMLTQANALLNTVGQTDLRALIDEAFTAFNGTGEQLRRLMDSMVLLVDSADKNVEATIDLVRQAGPLMATQSATADEIRSWTADVLTVTDQLRANNPEVTDLLRKGPPVAAQTQQLFSSMDQTLPMLIDNLGVASKTMAVYLPNLQQILVLYPRLMNSLLTAVNSGDPRYGPNVEFALAFQDPPPCTVGYLPKSQWRFPSATDARELPPGMLCRVPQDAQVAVRGARNYPCAEFPGRRAPTPAECRDGYQPSGEFRPAIEGVPGVPSAPAGFVVPGTPSGHEDGPAVYATTYDPDTGEFIGPDGKTYDAGTGARDRGRDTSWQSLITQAVNGA